MQVALKNSTFSYPFGSLKPSRNASTSNYRFGFNGQEGTDELSGVGNHTTATFWEYDTRLGRRWNLDPVDQISISNYAVFKNNPIWFVDPLGDKPDWVEGADGNIKWDKNATSQATTQKGEKYLGKNVLVGNHNRDASGNEGINTAKFDLYLASDKTGPSATVNGNTVPSDITEFGTLAEGLYPLNSQSRSSYVKDGKEDLALLINKGLAVPTTASSPKSSITEIFFHMGNNYQKSLFDSKNVPYSKGCQTSVNYPNSRPVHNAFMKEVGSNFNGSYYLRSKPVLTTPTIVPKQ